MLTQRVFWRDSDILLCCGDYGCPYHDDNTCIASVNMPTQFINVPFMCTSSVIHYHLLIASWVSTVTSGCAVHAWACGRAGVYHTKVAV